MTRPPAARMPASIREGLRAQHHPARTVDCPHCGAHDRGPCTTISGRRRKPLPCPARITAWAMATAVCPACQVAPGTPCNLEGHAYRDHVHPQRQTEAERTAA